MRSRCRCSMCPAIHINSRDWPRSSSTHEPSDPPLRAVFFVSRAVSLSQQGARVSHPSFLLFSYDSSVRYKLKRRVTRGRGGTPLRPPSEGLGGRKRAAKINSLRVSLFKPRDESRAFMREEGQRAPSTSSHRWVPRALPSYSIRAGVKDGGEPGTPTTIVCLRIGFQTVCNPIGWTIRAGPG